MIYVKVENNVAVAYPYNLTSLPTDYPQTSFPADIKNIDLAEYGVCSVVSQDMPPYNPATQIVEQSIPQKVGDEWFQQWVVVDLTPEEIAQREEAAKQSNKAQAESLLQATDWTENQSARNTEKTPHLVNGDEFDDYRVALRTIAVNPPVVVESWPAKPDENWVTI